MPYYYPDRDYHQLNAVAYPDHSRPLAGMDGIIRAFWRKGEQMWDQDMNNSMEWFDWWMADYAMNRWFGPNYPWYSPDYRIFLIEPDHNVEPTEIRMLHSVYHLWPSLPSWRNLKPWPGVMIPILADRQLVGFHQPTGGGDGGWQGLAMFQEYVDEIEISIFISETRADRIVAAHTVKEPFRLHADCYSGRVRGWTQFGQLAILKNGVQVGYAYQSEHSSGVRAISGLPVEFNTGDVLALRAPPVSPFVGKIYKGVTVSIVGELM